MYYQQKNYITTCVMIACTSSEMSKNKRSSGQNLLPVDAVKEPGLLPEAKAVKD